MPTLQAICDAHARIKSLVHRTPVLTSRALNVQVGAELFFKCENLQKVGAFKARGACNAVLSLSEDEARRGVVTHSSGNHGAALAWAAALRGIPATVVVPSNAPIPKKEAIERYGAKVVYCEPTVSAREAATRQQMEVFGYVLIHPFDNVQVIAGQGTVALELLEDYPDLDALIAPLGGGGLLSGTAIAGKGMRPSIRVYGSEPKGADDGYRGFSSGIRVTEMTPDTICDGLRTVLSERTFQLIRTHVDGIGTVSEMAIVDAMRRIWSLLKIVVEPSSAPPLAAILEGGLDVRGKRVGIIVSGGNVDLERLPWAAE